MSYDWPRRAISRSIAIPYSQNEVKRCIGRGFIYFAVHLRHSGLNCQNCLWVNCRKCLRLQNACRKCLPRSIPLIIAFQIRRYLRTSQTLRVSKINLRSWTLFLWRCARHAHTTSAAKSNWEGRHSYCIRHRWPSIAVFRSGKMLG